MRSWSVFVFLVALGVVPAAGAQTDGTDVALETLIRRLGHEEHAVRKEATKQLLGFGFLAVPALEKAAQSGDPEVEWRAKEILEQARIGIVPDWPADMADKARRYESLTPAERKELVRRVVETLGASSVPFLIRCLNAGRDADAEYVLDAMERAPDAAVSSRLAALLKTPKTRNGLRAVVRALGQLGRFVEALRVLSESPDAASLRAEQDVLRKKAVDALTGLLAADKPDAAAELAATFVAADPKDARFLYFQAEALERLARTNEAAALVGKALALNPAEEAPHYVAGDFLTDRGMRAAAIAEWETILRIPPADDVYDINAHVRLGQIHAHLLHYGLAADHYEKGLALYRGRKEAGGAGYGMVGASERDLEDMIKSLRRKALAADKLVGTRNGKSVRLQVEPVFVGGTPQEYRRALASAGAVLTLGVQPHGVRLLDAEACRFAYNPQRKQLTLLLKDSPCQEPYELDAGGRTIRLAARHLDCLYLYEVNGVSGEVLRTGRIEMNYNVKVVPDESLRKHKLLPVKIGEKEYAEADLRGGTVLDYLPRDFELVFEGEAADGGAETLRFSIPLDERDMDPE